MGACLHIVYKTISVVKEMENNLRAQKLMQARQCYSQQRVNTLAFSKEPEETSASMGYGQSFVVRSFIVLFILISIGFLGTMDAEKYASDKAWLVNKIEPHSFIEDAYNTYKDIPYSQIADELVALLGL